MSAPAKIHRPVEVLRDLPIDINSEKNLIWCFLRQPDLLRGDFLSFSVEDIHFGPHKRIVRAMVDLAAEGVVPDPGMIANRLTDPSDRDYLLDLIETMWASPSNAKFYAAKLHEVAAKRQALFDADKLTRAANFGVPEDIARVRKEIAKSASREGQEKSDWKKYRLDISRSATLKPPSQKFIVGHLPEEPGNYGLIIGPDGVRKSWLSLHIALAVAGGRPVAQGLDGSCLWPAPAQGRVVYITSEDSPDVMWRRVWSIAQMPGYAWVKDIGGNHLDILPTFSNMTLLTTAQDGSVVQTPECKELVEYAQGSRLIILDPLADLFDLDENGNREGRAIVQALRQISLSTGAGVLGVHHQNKSSMLTGEKNHQSGRGSSKFGAGCRWAVVLQPLSQALGEDWLKAAGVGEEEAKDWTSVHESKASYAEEYAGDAFFKKVAVVDDDGKLLAAAPLALRLTDINLKPGKKQKKEKESGYAIAY